MRDLRSLWQRTVNEAARRFVRQADVYGNGEAAALSSIAAGADVEEVAKALGCIDPPGTVILVEPAFVKYFEEGVNLLDLPEDQARAILGDAVYEQFIEAKRVSIPRGTIAVTAIDGTRSTSAKETKDG